MPQRMGRGRGGARPRHRANGTVYYEARVSIRGKQTSFYAETKTGAEAKARAALVDADRGVVKPNDAILVREHLESWLESVKCNVRGRTFAGYESHVRVHITPVIGHIKLVDLTTRHVRDLLVTLLFDKGLSETSVHHVRATLSGALKMAVLDHELPRNVASLVKIPSTGRPAFKPEVITPEHARQIIEAFSGSRLEPMVMFAAATGLRQGEMLALQWADVDFERREVTVRHSIDVRDGQKVYASPKTKKSRRVLRLSDLAVRALDIRRRHEEEDRAIAGGAWQATDLVFAGRVGGLRSGTAMTHNFRETLLRRGIEPVRWHALRRVFAAVLLDQGVSLPHIRDLLGHSQIQVTEHYAYTMPGALRDAIDAVDRALPLAGIADAGSD